MSVVDLFVLHTYSRSCTSKLLTTASMPQMVTYLSYIPYTGTNPSVSSTTTLNDIKYNISCLLNSLLAARNLNSRALRLVSWHGNPATCLFPNGVDLGSALADDEAVRLRVRQDQITN